MIVQNKEKYSPLVYFRAGAYVIKRKAWWQNAKVKAVGASALVIVLFLLIIIIIESNES